ncbi:MULTISPECIES: short-chain dehydrogenase/reductase [unclassified Nocardia]|uniref:short-chain dehydrogenase/reductase n=1 Tax=unclassified Nocardia TaxID=2637762 RepID=UPI001CE3E494|nr:MULTISPECIES: short-chain dehydrogenase/reductase [unclassified Nocardia]
MFPFPTRRDFDVRDKVVVVTGAASGIGAALAAELHSRGAKLVLIDVAAEPITLAAKAFGSTSLALAADIRDRTATAQAIDTAVDRFGRIDVVVANAGVAPAPATVRTVDPAEFDRVLDINLVGAFNTVRPALDQIAATRGHVVIVASAAAFAPAAGLSPYMISKAGVEQLGRALRIELAAVGASAGLAYFGFVRTPLARPIDEDPIGRKLDSFLPWPFNQRISAERAATVIADGITRRAAATFAPAGWREYSLLRGPMNLVIDRVAAGLPLMHSVIREIERRAAA